MSNKKNKNKSILVAGPQVSVLKSGTGWKLLENGYIQTTKELGTDWINALQHHFGYNYNTKLVSIKDLITKFNQLTNYLELDLTKDEQENPDLNNIASLMKDLQEEVNSHRQKVLAQAANGTVYYDDLPQLFSPGTWITQNNKAAIITGISQEMSMSGPYTHVWFINLRQDLEGKVSWNNDSYSIGYFGGVAQLNDLPIKLLDKNSDVFKSLMTRGTKFVEVTSKPHNYLAYTGNIMVPGGWTPVPIAATGRVMVDSVNLCKINPQQARNLLINNNSCHLDEQISNAVKDLLVNNVPTGDGLALLPDHVVGFSMRARRWGTIKLEGLKPITWRTDSFDKLVLEDEAKSVIKALVEHSNNVNFTDLIDGKGGGTIFLCHGKPGLGKTLTAEATAELLKKPLYVVSVGELGVNPIELEKNLKTALEIASAWDAVLLLDEADIFLEARDDKDILRNAMVGVFLRLLEYYPGVMFLTTNRVKNIDDAFFSRISLALNYEDGGVEMRKQIWVNLLGEAKTGLNNLVIDEMAQVLAENFAMNGRQIKNTLRNSLILAASKNTKLSLDLLISTAKLSANFTQETVNQRPVAINHSAPLTKQTIGFAISTR